jgi:uncharacterized protein with GYD domain
VSPVIPAAILIGCGTAMPHPKKERNMPKYFITGSYTQAGIKGVIGEGGTSRRAAVEKLATSVGGKVESFYFGFGGDDFFITADLPSNEAAAAVAMTVAASGAASPRTIVLMTPEEVDAATKLSPSYRAPGA